MTDLESEGIVCFDRQALTVDRFPPDSLVLAVPEIQMRNSQGAVRASDKVAGLLGSRVDRIFPAGQLPAPRRNDCIRHGDSGKNAVLKTQKNGGRLLHGIAPKDVGFVSPPWRASLTDVQAVIAGAYPNHKYR